MPKDNPIIHYNKSRKIFRSESERRHNDIFTGPSVKDMPAFDPDAPAVELSLTVPSWTSSIKRAQKNINAAIVSDRAKEKLKEVLCDLQDNIAEILALIEEE